MSNLTVEAKLDWIEISKEWKMSGQNQPDFCRDRGYSYSQFKNGRARLGLCRPMRKSRGRKVTKACTALKSSTVSFHPVTVENASPPSRLAEFVPENLKAEVEVELPFGVVLRFRGVTTR
jgi:hypothetical protein